MNTRNILCQQAVDSISKEPFSRFFQSFLSIFQTLLFHKLAKLDYNKNSLLACPWSNLHSFRPPFWVFDLRNPECSQIAFLGFQLDLFFFISFHFLWFKLPLRVFTLNLFFFFSFFFFLFLLARAALSGFQLWHVASLVISSIILLYYVGIDGTRKLFSIHLGEYQCPFWKSLFHNIRPFPIGWPFSTGVLSILRNSFEH